MNGKLIGIGVGPGDPELMTFKALKAIKECDVLAVPDADKGTSTAYRIVEGLWPEVESKEYFTLVMPMTHDMAKLRENYRRAADKVEEYLNSGRTVGFITLGDPSVYSTYMYVHKLILEDGFEAEIISGVTSFCAAAARLNISLAERTEMLHVVPSSHGIEKALDMPGTKVLMKAGSKMALVKEKLLNSEMNVMMVENCGMDTEQKYFSAEEIPDQASYYSLIIVKEKRKK